MNPAKGGSSVKSMVVSKKGIIGARSFCVLIKKKHQQEMLITLESGKCFKYLGKCAAYGHGALVVKWSVWCDMGCLVRHGVLGVTWSVMECWV